MDERNRENSAGSPARIGDRSDTTNTNSMAASRPAPDDASQEVQQGGRDQDVRRYLSSRPAREAQDPALLATLGLMRGPQYVCSIEEQTLIPTIPSTSRHNTLPPLPVPPAAKPSEITFNVDSDGEEDAEYEIEDIQEQAVKPRVGRSVIPRDAVGVPQTNGQLPLQARGPPGPTAPSAHVTSTALSTSPHESTSPGGRTRNSGSGISSDQNHRNAFPGRVGANCSIPRGVDITVVEICTFFPNALQVPQVACRLMQNRAFPRTLAGLQCHAVSLENDATEVKRAENQIKKQFAKAGIHKFGADANGKWNLQLALAAGVESDLTANQWQMYDGEGFRNCYLKSIYEALPDFRRWPKGLDRGVITQVLEYAKSHESEAYNTQDWTALIQQQRYQAPVLRAGAANRDIEAMSRWDAVFDL